MTKDDINQLRDEFIQVQSKLELGLSYISKIETLETQINLLTSLKPNTISLKNDKETVTIEKIDLSTIQKMLITSLETELIKLKEEFSNL